MAETFAEFWAECDRKVAKRDAEKAYNQVLKRGIKPEAILASLRLMKATEWKGRKREFLPYPATFLRGEAFDLEERTEALVDDAPTQPERHMHWCRACSPSHDWECDDPICMWPSHFPCPEDQQRAKDAISGVKTKKVICNV